MSTFQVYFQLNFESQQGAWAVNSGRISFYVPHLLLDNHTHTYQNFILDNNIYESSTVTPSLGDFSVQNSRGTLSLRSVDQDLPCHDCFHEFSITPGLGIDSPTDNWFTQVISDVPHQGFSAVVCSQSTLSQTRTLLGLSYPSRRLMG